MTSSKLTLYICTICPFAQRARVAVYAKNIPHELVEIDNNVLLRKVEKPAFLLQKNPYGAVPVVDHNGISIYESAIILNYLEEAFPDHGDPLLPASATLRAKARMLMHDCDRKVIPFIYSVMFNSDPNKGEAELEKNLEDGLQYFEDRLEDAYLLGKQLSLVDIALAPFIERLQVVVGKLKSRDYLDKFAKLSQWYNVTMQNVEAFQRTKCSEEELLENYKEYIELRRNGTIK